MNAFEGVYVINEEVSLEDFCNYDIKGLEKFDNEKTILVGKRSEGTIFSHRISKQEKEKQLKLIKDNDIKILNIVRNGFDVVDSQYKAWGINDPLEWLGCIKEAVTYGVGALKYQELIGTPKKTQDRVIKNLGLKKQHNFSDYPYFVPENCFASNYKEYGLRKLKKVTHTERIFNECDGLDRFQFIYYNHINGFKE